MQLPSEDKELRENIAKVIPCNSRKGMTGAFCPVAITKYDCPHCEWALAHAHIILRLVDEHGYYKGLLSSVEEALNSGDGTYRP